MPYDRKKAKEKLRERAKTTYERSGGGSKVIKAGIPQWACKEGKHKIDILPFLVGKKHPELEKGDPDYTYEVFVHFGVGVNEDAFICLKMFGEDCPICDHKQALDHAGELDDDKKKELRPKQYNLYNVVCYDTPDEQKKGVQVWLVSNFFMQQKLRAIMQDESGEIINFFETDKREGKKVMFERKGAGAGNTSFLGHKFVDRDYDIADKLLNATYALDEVVIVATYEEVEKAFFGKKRSTTDDDGSIHSHSVDAEQERDVSDSVADETEALKEMTRKELKQFIVERGLNVDADDYETKDDLLEAVLEQCGAGENSADLEEEEKEAVCPHKKGTFGKSFDQFEDCSECDYFDACSDEHDKMKPPPKSKINRRG